MSHANQLACCFAMRCLGLHLNLHVSWEPWPGLHLSASHTDLTEIWPRTLRRCLDSTISSEDRETQILNWIDGKELREPGLKNLTISMVSSIRSRRYSVPHFCSYFAIFESLSISISISFLFPQSFAQLPFILRLISRSCFGLWPFLLCSMLMLFSSVGIGDEKWSICNVKAVT